VIPFPSSLREFPRSPLHVRQVRAVRWDSRQWVTLALLLLMKEVNLLWLLPVMTMTMMKVMVMAMTVMMMMMMMMMEMMRQKDEDQNQR